MKSAIFVEVARNGKIGCVRVIKSELPINDGFLRYKIESEKGMVSFKGKELESDIKEGRTLHQGKYKISKID